MGPPAAVGGVGVGRSGHHVGAIAEAHRAAVGRLRRDLHHQRSEHVEPAKLLAAGAVVGQEEDEGVVERGGALERADHAPDRAIHRRDHRGIDLHPAGLPLAVGGLVPRGDGGIARRQHSVVGHDPELALALEARGAQLVPAGVEPSAIVLDVLRLRLHRPVRRGEREIEEERAIGRRRDMGRDHRRGAIAERRR